MNGKGTEIGADLPDLSAVPLGALPQLDDSVLDTALLRLVQSCGDLRTDRSERNRLWQQNEGHSDTR
jgi:FXSXX-COOH protein